MPGKHSELSPSSAVTWLNCPGSRRLVKETRAALLAAATQAPLDKELATAVRAALDDSSDAADEGTDAHELAALCLSLDVDAVHFLGKIMTLGHEVDEEMVEGVQQYLDYVRPLPGDHLIEEWLDLSQLTGEEGGGGTGDHVATGPELHVTDFKYGRTPVQVEGNVQTRIYAAGALLHDPMALSLSATRAAMRTRVVMAIVQPRVFSEPQIEEISGADLVDWVNGVLIPGARATLDPDAPLVPGTAQCMWCKAKGNCRAYAEYAVAGTGARDLVEFSGGFVPPAPTGMSGEQLGAVMERAAIVRKWLDAVEAEGAARLYTGQRIGTEAAPWKLVRGKKGNRKWADGQEDAVAAVLRANYGLANETIFKLDLLSPAKILALPDVKADPDLVSVFITQKEGSLVPAPSTDKRAAHVPRELIAAEFETID